MKLFIKWSFTSSDLQSVFSVLMFVVLSWYEPADALCPQDGVYSEACDEEDREDQQPVDALHRDAGEGAKAVCIRHVIVRADFKPWKTNSLSKNTADWRSSDGIHIVLIVESVV